VQAVILVCAGQRIHHRIDAEAKGQFALALAIGQPIDQKA